MIVDVNFVKDIYYLKLTTIIFNNITKIINIKTIIFLSLLIFPTNNAYVVLGPVTISIILHALIVSLAGVVAFFINLKAEYKTNLALLATGA